MHFNVERVILYHTSHLKCMAHNMILCAIHSTRDVWYTISDCVPHTPIKACGTQYEIEYHSPTYCHCADCPADPEPSGATSFIRLMDRALMTRLWDWHRPSPANLCHYDVFLATELFMFAEAEARGFLSDIVRRSPNMMSLTSILQSITSTTIDMDVIRYEEAKKIMKNGNFGQCRDVAMHLHRLFKNKHGGNEALRSVHAVTTVARPHHQPWHVKCGCSLPPERSRTVSAISIASGWYDTNNSRCWLTNFISVAEALNFTLGTRTATEYCPTENCSGSFCWEQTPVQHLPPLLVVFLPEPSASGHVVPGWDAPSLTVGDATYDLVAVSAANGSHYTACLAQRPLGSHPDWYAYDDMSAGGKLVPVPLIRGVNGDGPANIRRGYYPRALHYVAQAKSVDGSNRVLIHTPKCRDSLTLAQLKGHHQNPFWLWEDSV